MNRPIKRLATSALALLLALSMLLSVAAEDIEFSGIPGGGGLQNNSDGTPKYNVYGVKGTQFNYQHLVGYRFSVVTKSGQIKNNTSPKNIFLAASYSGETCYEKTFKRVLPAPNRQIFMRHWIILLYIEPNLCYNYSVSLALFDGGRRYERKKAR